MKLCTNCYKAPARDGGEWCPQCALLDEPTVLEAKPGDPVRIIPLAELLNDQAQHELTNAGVELAELAGKLLQRGADIVAMDGCSLHSIEFAEGDSCPACVPMYEAAELHRETTGHLVRPTPAGLVCAGCEWSAIVGKIDDTPPPGACVQCGLPAWRGRLRCEAHHLAFVERAAAEAELAEREQRRIMDQHPRPLPPKPADTSGRRKPGTRGKVQPEVLQIVRDMLEECTPTSMIQEKLSNDLSVDKRTVRTWITRVRKAISGETKKEGLDAQLYRKGQFVAFLERVAFESLSKGKYSQAVRAAHEIGLAYGFLGQKIELTGANGGPIETQQKLDEGLLEHLHKLSGTGSGGSDGGAPPAPPTPAE